MDSSKQLSFLCIHFVSFSTMKKKFCIAPLSFYLRKKQGAKDMGTNYCYKFLQNRSHCFMYVYVPILSWAKSKFCNVSFAVLIKKYAGVKNMSAIYCNQLT